MKNCKFFVLLLSVMLIAYLNSCSQAYDSELMKPDGHGGGYILTPLGCLINGPWQLFNSPVAGYNSKLFLNDSEISSKGYPYDEIQKDLVFELHKNRTITYWLKSENGLMDTIKQNEIKVIRRQSYEQDNLKKVYTKGYWEVNFDDSSLLLHFEEKDIPELRFKYSNLGNGHVDFHQIIFFDSVYNGRKVKFKKVNTIYYETLYPRL